MSLKAEIPAITIKSAIKPLVTSLLVFHTLFFFFFSFFVPETDLLFLCSKVITSDDMSSRLVSFFLLSLTLKVLFFFSNSLSLFPFLLIFLIGQLISISSRKSREEELLRQIEEYEQYIETAKSDCEVYQGRIWLEIAVRELLALRGENADTDTASVVVSVPSEIGVF